MVAEVAWVQRVEVRELGAADATAVAAMAGRCGADTLYRRFHGPRTDAGEALAADVRRAEPLSRCHLGATAGGRLVGLASLVPSVDGWEAAVLVEDAWQRRGVGRALAIALAQAARERRASGIRLTVLAEAVGPVRALVRSAGWRTLRGTLSVGVFELEAVPA